MNSRGPKSGFRKTILLRRQLRKNTTEAEKIFWSKVARRQFYNLKFRKQHGIGNYIVDFYCSEKKFIVEIDGDTHAENDGRKKDEIRSKYLLSLGYNIVRYNNHDIINNIEGVFEDLKEKLILL